MRWLMGGRVLDVVTGEVRRADVGIADGRVAAIGTGTRRDPAGELVGR